MLLVHVETAKKSFPEKRYFFFSFETVGMRLEKIVFTVLYQHRRASGFRFERHIVPLMSTNLVWNVSIEEYKTKAKIA